mgnify:FL=1|jgi:hypothetical protein
MLSKVKSKEKSKPCDLCSTESYIRYRIQYQKNGDWQLVCFPCWQKVSQDNPFYRYGGTWKARK